MSAPALQLLSKGADHDAADILRLAVHELVGLGALIPTTLQAGEGRDTVHTAAFTTGRRATDLEVSLSSVLEAHATATAHEGMVTIQDLARSLRAAHDDDLAKWVEDDVLSMLIERKLYEKEEGKRLGIIPTTSVELTPEGRAAQAQLNASVDSVSANWNDWVSKDERRAQTFLDLAGSGVLLVPDIYDDVLDFRKAQSGGGTPTPTLGTAGETSQSGDASLASSLGTTGDTSHPGVIIYSDDTSGSSAGAMRFDIDRLALYANELKVVDDVIAYTKLDD